MSAWWRNFSLCTLLITCLSLAISGRKGFILVGLISVPLSIIILRACNIKVSVNYKKISIIILLILAVFFISSYYLDINLSGIYDIFIYGFNFQDSSNISANRRYVQFFSLIEGWAENPFTGSGFGAVASDNKSEPIENIPWAYELQYIALLYQAGILGILVYGSAIIWVFAKMIKISRKYADLANLIIPVMVGLACFLIVNSTNPYLSKFDFLWTIFLPIGLINIGLLRDNDNRLQKNKLFI